jgi:hypothetical protein
LLERLNMLTKNIDRMRAEVACHIAADAVVAGHYWDKTVANDIGGTGCFIGCLAHSSDATVLTDTYGLPLVLTRVCESIFERLSLFDKAAGVAFFAVIPDAIGRDGKDLSRVHWAFLAAELRALPVTSAEIQTVIEGMDLLANGQEWSAARAAYAAADAAAAYADAAYVDAARAAAYAAAYAAYADAAYVDAARADAAYAAADAAAAARADAAAAARAATMRQRDTILRLMKEAV